MRSTSGGRRGCEGGNNDDEGAGGHGMGGGPLDALSLAQVQMILQQFGLPTDGTEAEVREHNII